MDTKSEGYSTRGQGYGNDLTGEGGRAVLGVSGGAVPHFFVSGTKWIFTRRQKTDFPSSIPILSMALEFWIGMPTIPMPATGQDIADPEQSENECLPERDCGLLRCQEEPNLPYCTAHICDYSYPEQWRPDRDGLQNAGASQPENHPALCEDPGQKVSQDMQAMKEK
jgi:hypothetical protein